MAQKITSTSIPEHSPATSVAQAAKTHPVCPDEGADGGEGGEVFSVVASRRVVSNPELHYHLSSVQGITLLERHAEPLGYA